MKIHIIRSRATQKQVLEMLEELETYVKLAVDVERNLLAGGGEYHADCEQALIEDGSRQENTWGADWYPASKTVDFVAPTNIRPRQGNRGMKLRTPIYEPRSKRSCGDYWRWNSLEGSKKNARTFYSGRELCAHG